MGNVDITVDLDNDTVSDLIRIYIRHNMSSASYEVFDMDNNGFMIAAANALRNEAIINGIKLGMKHDNLPQT